MFHITGTSTPARTLIRIDGSLTAQYVSLAEQYCLEALRSGRRVELLLREITAIDQAGQEFLLRLARQGVRLRALGLYFSELLRRLHRSATRRRPALPSKPSSSPRARRGMPGPGPGSKSPTGL